MKIKSLLKKLMEFLMSRKGIKPSEETRKKNTREQLEEFLGRKLDFPNSLG